MLKNLLNNWKTTSAGATTILGSVIHLIFAIRAGTADENTWTTSLVAIVLGVGLVLAGDSSQSVKTTEALKSDVATAIESGNTDTLRKPTEPIKT